MLTANITKSAKEHNNVSFSYSESDVINIQEICSEKKETRYGRTAKKMQNDPLKHLLQGRRHPGAAFRKCRTLELENECQVCTCCPRLRFCRYFILEYRKYWKSALCQFNIVNGKRWCNKWNARSKAYFQWTELAILRFSVVVLTFWRALKTTMLKSEFWKWGLPRPEPSFTKFCVRDGLEDKSYPYVDIAFTT